MITGSARNARHYQNAILRYINDNPEQFANLKDVPVDGTAEKALPVRFAGRVAPRKATETERAFDRGLRSGFTFGLDDEIGAGWYSLGAMFDDREMGDVYDAELERLRAESAYLQAQHPFAYGGGTVVGAVINPVSYLPVGWAARGAALAGNAGKLAKIAKASHAMAKAGAIDGAVYGFNSGEGGLESRLANSVEGAGLGIIGGAVAPVAGQGLVMGGQLAARGLGRIIEPMLESSSRNVINKIAQNPQEAAALAEKARLMRRDVPQLRHADLPEILSTAYDLAVKKGQRLSDEMRVMHQGLYGTGKDTALVELTTPRVNRIGAAYVGPGHLSEDLGRTLLSRDEYFQYRQPALKKNKHANNTTGYQANFERELRRKRKFREYRNNLHVNITDLPPGP